MINKPLSSKDWELLSAYLDGELNPQEQLRVEERLNSSPEYKKAFEGLKRTKLILNKAPVHKVPRNFTLTAAQVQPVKVPRWTFTMQWGSAVVALIAVFMFATQLLPGLTGRFTTAVSDQTAQAPLSAATEMAAPEASSLAAEPPLPGVIYWGGPPLPGGQATGKGGGGGGDGSSPGIDCSQPGAMCGGGADNTAIGGGAAEPPADQLLFPQPPIPNPIPDLQTNPNPDAARNAAPITGTGPVLGVRPDGDQGTTLPETNNTLAASEKSGVSESTRAVPWLLIGAGGLLAAAIGLFIFAFTTRRNILR